MFHKRDKLNNEDVKEIIKLFKAGGSTNSIARRYNVCRKSIVYWLKKAKVYEKRTIQHPLGRPKGGLAKKYKAKVKTKKKYYPCNKKDGTDDIEFKKKFDRPLRPIKTYVDYLKEEKDRKKSEAIKRLELNF